MSAPQHTSIRFHEGDLPAGTDYGGSVAIDTETMGLNPFRDRLCVVQLSGGDGTADVVRIARGQKRAPNLEALLADPKVVKIFHFARFDIAALFNRFGVMTTPVYCTKIASKLVRTYTDRHGLKDLCSELLGIELSKQQQSSDWAAKDLLRELLGIEISKQQQSSDWGADSLSEAQLAYAASDVLHLHRVRERLDDMLRREERAETAAACFAFLPTRARLDLMGWGETDIFSHE